MMQSILLVVQLSTGVSSEQEGEQIRIDVDVAHALLAAVRPALLPTSTDTVIQPALHHSGGIDVVIGVLTRRNAFETRAVIRETWAHGYTGSVFFVLGRSCPVPPNLVRLW